MLSNVKGSVRNSQYERFYDTLFNLIGSAILKKMLLTLLKDVADSQSQEEKVDENKEDENLAPTPVNSVENEDGLP